MWDTGYSSDIWALLDPASLREVNSLFLQLNRSQVSETKTKRRIPFEYYASAENRYK
jgi:hypothetical protein